jgi:membrane protein implicated in regulation of membrane protease activity
MEWLSDHAWAAWLGIAAVLGMAELVSLDLVLVIAAIGAAVIVQILVAGAASVAMLAVVRPSLVARLHTGPELRLGASKLVGQRAVVTQRMTGLSVGQIRLAGETWSAAPYDEHETIEPGVTVEVFEIRGATAYVHPVGELGE